MIDTILFPFLDQEILVNHKNKNTDLSVLLEVDGC